MQRILVVDDSATARMFIRRCLEIAGIEAEVVEASNGKEALALLKQNPTDVVMADLNMPLMDGETLLRWIKTTPKLQAIPVIFITSAKNTALAEQLSSQGAHTILSKPVNPATISEAFSSLNA